MYTNEKTFEMDFEDLEEALQSEKETSLRNASNTLRRMFLDGSPLVHVVNRAYKLTLEFEILDVVAADEAYPIGQLPGLVFRMQKIGLDPSEFPHLPITKVDLRKFLKTEVIKTEYGPLTVRDYIMYIAINMGGVHKEDVKNDKILKAIGHVGSTMFFNNRPIPLEAMKDIMSISIKAIRPIYIAIKNRKGTV